jgi:hypothetical protein
VRGVVARIEERARLLRGNGTAGTDYKRKIKKRNRALGVED